MTDSEYDRQEFTIYSTGSERFRQLREHITEMRGGVEPTRAELMRLLMENFDPTDRGI